MSEKVSQIRQTEEDSLSSQYVESPPQASLAENPSLALRLRLHRRLIPFPAALALLVLFSARVDEFLVQLVLGCRDSCLIHAGMTGCGQELA